MSKKNILSILASMLVSPKPDVLETLSTDLTECPEGLAPFVVAIEVGEFDKQPNVADLEISIFDENGKPQKVKPTAEQRDQAWAFYSEQQEASSEVELKEKPKGKTSIKFIRPWRNYVTGDVTARPHSVAKTLIDKGYAKRYAEDKSTDK